MKSINPIGIHGYAAYVPSYRIRTSEIARVWKGGGAGPNESKAVACFDEDVVTMSAEVAREALGMAGSPPIGAIYVGTESKPYAVKSTGSILSDMLGFNRSLGADLEFACKAGTEAMQVVSGLVGSGMIDYGLAIGADTAQGAPGDELEHTAASGAAALVIGRADGNDIAEIKYSTSYISDTPDFWRRQTQHFPSHLGRFTGEPAYFDHTIQSSKHALSDTGTTPKDYRFAIFHQPNPRFPFEVGKRLGFTQEQIMPGAVNNLIGNTYAAGAMMALSCTLDEANPGDRIFMTSFGSGAGSDTFVIEVKDRILKRRLGSVRLKERMKKFMLIDYGIYAKWRGKIRE